MNKALRIKRKLKLMYILYFISDEPPIDATNFRKSHGVSKSPRHTRIANKRNTSAA